MSANDKNGHGKTEAHKGAPATRHTVNTVDRSTYIQARILFPALGCPAVINPQGTGSFATRGICMLLVSEREKLTVADVARHVRIVSWERRRTRYTAPRSEGGSDAFNVQSITVRPLKRESAKGLTQLHQLGGISGHYLGLSNDVLNWYSRHGLRYLHEIRVDPSALSQLVQGELYNLLWVNENKQDGPQQRSAEMNLLIRNYAWRSRLGNDNVPSWDRFKKYFATEEEARKHWIGMRDEYEYDYQRHERPSNTAIEVTSASSHSWRSSPARLKVTPKTPDNRTECLHPVFVRSAQPRLRIGHLTDTHVDIRCDTYAANLRAAGNTSALQHYVNWNDSFEKFYRSAQQNCGVLLLTGDLIDYGRGFSERAGAQLGHGSDYWRDRNWFLFYSLFASGGNYRQPAYTILGNHDWRINPYPPFGRGAPDPEDMGFRSKDDLRAAHGSGYEPGLAYHVDLRNVASHFRQKVITHSGSLENRGTPLETRIESVAWYLLLINPFLDYACPLPGGYNVVMLDWAENEKVDFPLILGGKDYGKARIKFWDVRNQGGPMAMDSLSTDQRILLDYASLHFDGPKILGVHAPPISPWPHWTDDHLARGVVQYTAADIDVLRPKRRPVGDTGHTMPVGEFRDRESHETEAEYKEKLLYSRGATERPGDSPKRLTFEHEAYAFRPSAQDPLGQEADYESVAIGRERMIRLLRAGPFDPLSPDRVQDLGQTRAEPQSRRFNLVLSGHVHRQNIMALEVTGPLPGRWIVKEVGEKGAPAAAQPVFINTTSAGPLGKLLEHRKRKLYGRPGGYMEVTIAATGKIEAVEPKRASLVRMNQHQTVTP